MKFQTHYVRNERTGEQFTPDTKTEQTGWLTTQQHVERLIQAGERLEAARKEQFHFLNNHDIPEDFEEIPTEPHYDPITAQEELSEINRRLYEAATNQATADIEPGEGAQSLERTPAVPPKNEEQSEDETKSNQPED